MKISNYQHQHPLKTNIFKSFYKTSGSSAKDNNNRDHSYRKDSNHQHEDWSIEFTNGMNSCLCVAQKF